MTVAGVARCPSATRCLRERRDNEWFAGWRAPDSFFKQPIRPSRHCERKRSNRDRTAETVLDCVVASLLAMTQDTRPHSRGVTRPSCAGTARLKENKRAQATLKRREGAGNAGCPLHPQPRVQSVVSTRVSSPQVQPESPGIPRAMVLTAYGALSPATNSTD
jgi:hypothetical protein